MTTPARKTVLTIGRDSRVELLIDGQNNLIGLGAVHITGVSLRNSTQPILIRLDTPEGILYTRVEVVDIAQPKPEGEAVIKLRAIGMPWGRMALHDDYQQSMIALGLPTEPVVDELLLTLSPSSLDLDGRHWYGFSYAFHFRSDKRRIHRLWTHATWEIGGSVEGNTVLSQGQCNMPVYVGAKDKLFTTACLRTLDQYGSPQGNSFQLGPRAGLIQGFDFQNAHSGALFQYWADFSSIASLTESPPGCDRLHIVDEHRFPLTSEVTTPAKHVLFTPGNLGESDVRDQWWAARELVYGAQRKKFGVKPSHPVAEGGFKYSTRVHEGRLRIKIAGVEVDSTEVPYAIGDHAIPRMAAAGFTRFFPDPFSQSDVSEIGLKRKLDDGIHGDLHCSSVCATHRFFPSDFWGGMKAWRYMSDKGRAHGVEVGAWFAPHLSPRAPIYREHPEYMMVSVDGLPSGGGYGMNTIVVADWNTGIYQWALDDMKRWHDEGGLEYVFIDSLSNMGLLQANYTAAMRTNYDALARLWADFQKIGIKSLSFECVAPPFGYGRFGLADLRGDLMGQDKSVAGQNDFGWWVGNEDMAVDLGMMVEPRKRTDAELEQILFRLMANRGFATFMSMISHTYEVPEWYSKWLRVYQRALPMMTGQRRVFPGESVHWQDDQRNTRLIWAIKPVKRMSSGPWRVTRLDREWSAQVKANEWITLEPWGVYSIER